MRKKYVIFNYNPSSNKVVNIVEDFDNLNEADHFFVNGIELDSIATWVESIGHFAYNSLNFDYDENKEVVVLIDHEFTFPQSELETYDANEYVKFRNALMAFKPETRKSLFVPRGLSYDEDNRYYKWNKEQPTKVVDEKEVRINQWDFDGKKQGYWEAFKEEPFVVEEGYYINDIKRLELSGLDIIFALNKVNERLKKIEDIISSNHWKLQNCIRFYLMGVQIGFRMWQMNIPRLGENVGIKFFEDDESLEYVRQFFPEYQGQVNDNYLFTDNFFFTIESVTCVFTEGIGIENDSGCEYHLQLKPKLSQENKTQN
jgi:hypothetical protein